MPLETTPRSLPRVMRTPPGRRDLCSAAGTMSPAGEVFGAGDDLHRLLLAHVHSGR